MIERNPKSRKKPKEKTMMTNGLKERKRKIKHQ